jgi:hypothetical protein
MHAVKHIAISACEGPTHNEYLYKKKLFTSYQEVDQVLALLAPRDETMPGYYKCFVHVIFDDDATYEAKLELTNGHRHRASILLPHIISHCEVMSGRVVPPHLRDDVDRWTRVLDELEESTPNMRAQYALMLDVYLS